MASKTKNVKRPENMQHTLRIFVSYLGRHKFMLLIVSILVTVSALANLLGTYMIRPVVNNLANGICIHLPSECLWQPAFLPSEHWQPGAILRRW